MTYGSQTSFANVLSFDDAKFFSANLTTSFDISFQGNVELMKFYLGH